MTCRTGRYTELRDALARRVLTLDGAMGTAVMDRCPPGGCVDMLSLSAPGLVGAVHRSYLESGADIIRTNTFNANRLTLSRYESADTLRGLNAAGVAIARAEAARMEAADPSRPRFVAGTMGPLPSPDPDAAAEQSAVLMDNGVDLLILETCYDAQILDAQLRGVRRATAGRGLPVPVFVSVTISGQSGRLHSGHTLADVLEIVRPYGIDALGLNCDAPVASLRELAAISPLPTIYYPNAGAPGAYKSADQFVGEIRSLLAESLLNIVGGCCGTDSHCIRHLSRLASRANPRRP